MGLFNSGKNNKVDKVDKYEEHYEVAPSKPHHRSSKHHSKKVNGALIRQMPQPSLMPTNQNYFPSSFGYPQTAFTNSPQFSYGFPSNVPYDLSKYVPSATPFNSFMPNQFPPTNFAPIWSNGISPFADRSPFQQQQQQQPAFNMYQQPGWPSYPPSTNGYMPPMNF